MIVAAQPGFAEVQPHRPGSDETYVGDDFRCTPIVAWRIGDDSIAGVLADGRTVIRYYQMRPDGSIYDFQTGYLFPDIHALADYLNKETT
jgi:hypothetical protein